MSRKYFPDRGDPVRLNFSLKAGNEQSGRRPAVVVSPRSYNKNVGLGLFCPITSQIKGYPFEVRIPADIGISGVVLIGEFVMLNLFAGYQNQQ